MGDTCQKSTLLGCRGSLDHQSVRDVKETHHNMGQALYLVCHCCVCGSGACCPMPHCGGNVHQVWGRQPITAQVRQDMYYLLMESSFSMAFQASFS